ncbi:CDP-alcohol phosphatidyltransferase family protein [Rhodoplanes serenus]|uniref:CDP-diacylglycerol--glycerol-3-phosphate 3-phosphatidyltransferase n=1 Tax=Rhodoplanes serenus TaxID=200615 RepID=A0A327JZU2_9BRAD|nr:CDP-alcohol phosphatidyltransferase family protein [Rhodoplanes serenus]MBI5114245.1 CDP-alcohol phosphatidyltransferase family protein [Rhodovulum sp.]MTW15714.1 CDP-alcohol phosphatidyltransferase family protein [Rhodoplanes serenus]RAI31531.1 CDP-alcohol phosphatidyltransferase [Rhodoplanes serenus]
MNLPNVVTIARILLVPVLVWAIAANEMRLAFLLFLAAGLSDAIDGFLAKRFGMTTEFGAHLDPLADKALIIAIFVGLGMVGAIPLWLVILVVSRDVLIVAAVMFTLLLGRPIKVRPLWVSKLNTVVQIVFASVVLAALGFGFDAQPVQAVLMYLVAALTLVSIGFYTREWVHHMNATEGEPG